MLLAMLLVLLFSQQKPLKYQGPQINLSDYRLLKGAIPIQGTSKNASGLTYNPDSKSLFVVINDPPKILELDTLGKTLREIRLLGFGDTEGIIYLGNHLFALTEERKRHITYINIFETTTRVDYHKVQSFQVLASKEQNNKGLEGLTYDLRYKHFYTVNEKRPRQLLAVPDPQLAPVPLKHRELWDIEQHSMKLADLAGIHLDYKSGNLLLLSEESKLIVETTLDGKSISYLDLSANHSGLTHSIHQPEGITMDDQDRLYICSEPNLLYIFEKKKLPNQFGELHLSMN